MRVHLAEIGRHPQDVVVDEFRTIAAASRSRAHVLTERADDADLILFTQCHMLTGDWSQREIREHPLRRQYPLKSFVYDERDRPWCFLPGVYASMPKRFFHADFQRACGYFRTPAVPPPSQADLLFSFIGSNSDSCRPPLFSLRHSNAVVEEVDRFTFYDPTSKDFDARRARFQEVLSRSRFVLCPRGRGTSSIRMYETLAVGRVPIIIADDWVPPEGPNWDAFSVRWPEGQTRGLIPMLEALDSQWGTLSREARAAYAQYFAPDVMFDRIIDMCGELLAGGAVEAFPANGIRDRGYFAVAADTARWKTVSTLRRNGRRATERLNRLASRG